MSLWLSGSLRIILSGCCMIAWSAADQAELARPARAGLFIIGLGVWIMAAVPWRRSGGK